MVQVLWALVVEAVSFPKAEMVDIEPKEKTGKVFRPAAEADVFFLVQLIKAVMGHQEFALFFTR